MQAAYHEYYADPSVQERIGDFFGGSLPHEASAVFMTPGTETSSDYHTRRPLEEWQSWLRRGAEINRSLWDRESLVADLDIEYVNFDRPTAFWEEPERIFRIQEPIVNTVDAFLGGFGIPSLHILTGRGHHFVWRIGKGCSAYHQLANLGRTSASLQRLYATEFGPCGETIEPELGAAFAGLGLVIEYSAREIQHLAAPQCEAPIDVAAVEPGGGAHGREMIAIDITEYGDSLCARSTRAPFSAYLKASQNKTQSLVAAPPPIFAVPLKDFGVAAGLEIRSDVRAVQQLAAVAETRIPDASAAMNRLISTYRLSPLAAFHHAFYAEEHDAPALWRETYDQTNLSELPACVRFMLSQPNDLLLRPACVKRVVRVLLAHGWHPRHIGGLIRSKYERDFGWGAQWLGSDPATRADFYARVFAGAVFTGRDSLIDFNCQSAKDEGLCFVEGCGGNLQDLHHALLDRRIP